MMIIILLVFCSLASSLAAVDHFIPLILARYAHDSTAFTQGLAIFEQKLYESTGLYGQSTLRCISLLDGKELQRVLLPKGLFGEGIAVFPNKIWQITWRQKAAYLYDRLSLKKIKKIRYRGEGWGLCRDGDHLWMSDGSNCLAYRHGESFAIIKKMVVNEMGFPISGLNDLECVGPYLFANLWHREQIAIIDKADGQVIGRIDLSTLLSEREKGQLGAEDVANGIAYSAERKSFFLTGKRWPWIFEVRIIPK
jgi:glutaminyl-peptide cyclotransferase